MNPDFKNVSSIDFRALYGSVWDFDELSILNLSVQSQSELAESAKQVEEFKGKLADTSTSDQEYPFLVFEVLAYYFIKIIVAKDEKKADDIESFLQEAHAFASSVDFERIISKGIDAQLTLRNKFLVFVGVSALFYDNSLLNHSGGDQFIKNAAEQVSDSLMEYFIDVKSEHFELRDDSDSDDSDSDDDSIKPKEMLTYLIRHGHSFLSDLFNGLISSQNVEKRDIAIGKVADYTKLLAGTLLYEPIMLLLLREILICAKDIKNIDRNSSPGWSALLDLDYQKGLKNLVTIPLIQDYFKNDGERKSPPEGKAIWEAVLFDEIQFNFLLKEIFKNNHLDCADFINAISSSSFQDPMMSILTLQRSPYLIEFVKTVESLKEEEKIRKVVEKIMSSMLDQFVLKLDILNNKLERLTDKVNAIQTTTLAKLTTSPSEPPSSLTLWG